jgi:hypothetical protein
MNPSHLPDEPRQNDVHNKPAGGGAASLLAELRGADGARSEAALPPRKPPRVSGQTLVLVLILGVSAAALFTMRQMSRRSGIRMETINVSYTPDENSRRRAVDQARIVQFLVESGTPVQVPRESLDKNPFYLGVSAAALPIGVDPAEIEAHRRAEQARQAALAREQEIRSRLGTLILHSVLGGRTPIARINDATVRVGDTVAELFTVVAIEGRTVTLECDGQRYTLDLDAKPDQPASRPGTPSRPR